MPSLYELTNDFNEIVKQLEEYELEPEVFQSTLDSLQTPIEQKVENIIKHIKNLESLAEVRKAEAKRLSELAAKDLKQAESFKNYMADNLRKANIKNLQAGAFTLGWRKGSEVVQVDESRLPKEYWIPQPMKPESKGNLKHLLKEGIEIQGVSLVRNPDTLTIK